VTVVYAIKDMNSGEFYQQKATRNGWYDDIRGARFFKEAERAQHTAQHMADTGNHHVRYPGNRSLKVVTVKLEQT